MSDDLISGWYAVRCVFAKDGVADNGARTYEERVTLWRAASFAEAIRRAGVEAE